MKGAGGKDGPRGKALSHICRATVLAAANLCRQEQGTRKEQLGAWFMERHVGNCAPALIIIELCILLYENCSAYQYARDQIIEACPFLVVLFSEHLSKADPEDTLAILGSLQPHLQIHHTSCFPQRFCSSHLALCIVWEAASIVLFLHRPLYSTCGNVHNLSGSPKCCQSTSQLIARQSPTSAV